MNCIYFIPSTTFVVKDVTIDKRSILSGKQSHLVKIEYYINYSAFNFSFIRHITIIKHKKNGLISINLILIDYLLNSLENGFTFRLWE